MIIVLMGYMGSGKTSVGLQLTKILNYDFIDLDQFIESKELSSVSEVFKLKGEIFFRNIESQYLNEILSTRDNVILSLGGGTPCYGTNLYSILNFRKTKSIYLKASIPELVKRLMPEKGTRPLISHIESENEMMEFIGKHLFERSPFYSQANFTILTDHKDAVKITEDIVLQLI